MRELSISILETFKDWNIPPPRLLLGEAGGARHRFTATPSFAFVGEGQLDVVVLDDLVEEAAHLVEFFLKILKKLLN